MQTLRDAAGVIDALGGNNNVRKLFGFVPSAVANWRRDGRFPPDTYLLFREELIRRGLEAEPKLWKMRGYTPPEVESEPEPQPEKTKRVQRKSKGKARRNGKGKAR